MTLAKRPLGSTGIDVSSLGLGTVKFGRNQEVKYPTGFSLPVDRAIESLLDVARESGINLLDTAPAYGSSEQRQSTTTKAPNYTSSTITTGSRISRGICN